MQSTQQPAAVADWAPAAWMVHIPNQIQCQHTKDGAACPAPKHEQFQPTCRGLTAPDRGRCARARETAPAAAPPHAPCKRVWVCCVACTHTGCPTGILFKKVENSPTTAAAEGVTRPTCCARGGAPAPRRAAPPPSRCRPCAARAPCGRGKPWMQNHTCRSETESLSCTCAQQAPLDKSCG